MPILLEYASVNQMLLSGPTVIPTGPALGVGILYSVIIPSFGLSFPIWPARCSVNQTMPSGATTMPSGNAVGVGMGNSRTFIFSAAELGEAICPILLL